MITSCRVATGSSAPSASAIAASIVSRSLNTGIRIVRSGCIASLIHRRRRPPAVTGALCRRAAPCRDGRCPRRAAARGSGSAPARGLLAQRCGAPGRPRGSASWSAAAATSPKGKQEAVDCRRRRRPGRRRRASRRRAGRAARVSIALTGVPSLREGRSRASNAWNHGPTSSWKPTKWVESLEPELACELLELGAVGAVADHHERRVDAPVVQKPNGARTSCARLTAVMRPTQPTVNRSAAMPSESRSSVASLGALHAFGELDAEPDDRELRGATDAELDEIVADLGADGDERIGLAREPPLDDAGTHAASPGRSSREGVAVEGVDDDRGPRRPGEPGGGRPTAPALAVCVWRMCGRTCGSARRGWRTAVASASGETSRWSPGTGRTSMPRCSATNAIDPSPSEISPAASVVM